MEKSNKIRKTVLVTGASTGVGLALARMLIRLDTFHVVLTARESSLGRFAKEGVSESENVWIRPLDILSKKQLEIDAAIAQVNEDLCRGCGFCVDACPYTAIELIEKDESGQLIQVAHVNEALCKGCGSCSAACLNGAISHLGFTDSQILTMIKALGEI